MIQWDLMFKPPGLACNLQETCGAHLPEVYDVIPQVASQLLDTELAKKPARFKRRVKYLCRIGVLKQANNYEPCMVVGVIQSPPEVYDVIP